MQLLSYETLLLEELDDGLLEVTLSRPKQLNALNMVTVDELFHLINELKNPHTQKYYAIIIRGAERAFSSGGDLNEFLTIYEEHDSVIENYIAKFQRLTKSWYELPIPTIASLHGAVAGGGASLALASDIRIAADNTKIQFIFSRIGLIPDMGAHYLLPRLVGEANSLEWLYTGRPIQSEEALTKGLIHKIVPLEELQRQTIEYAGIYKHGSKEVYKHIKQLIKTNHLSLDQILNQETVIQTDRFKNHEFKDKIQNFFTKKK